MIALDLSRLLSRAGVATPTGIDRVELAYARHLLAGGKEYRFAAINAVGAIAALPQAEAARFVEALEAMWRDGAAPEEVQKIKARAWRLRRAALFAVGALRTRLREDTNPVYLLVSHSHLDRARGIARLKRASAARFVCLIHDLIPLDYPQYTSPAQTRRHRRRISKRRRARRRGGGQFRGDAEGADASAGTRPARRGCPARPRSRRRATGDCRAAIFRLSRHDRTAQEPCAAARYLAAPEGRPWRAGTAIAAGRPARLG